MLLSGAGGCLTGASYLIGFRARSGVERRRHAESGDAVGMTSQLSWGSSEKSDESLGRGPRGLTRRQVLQGGAVALGAVAFEAEPAEARVKKEHASLSTGRLETSFDEGWLFFRGDPSGAQAPSFDD